MRGFCLIIGFIGIAIPALANVGNGDACDRAGESSMFQGQYLLCTGGVWTAQAPQAISVGLNATACTASKVGLLRVLNVPLAGNSLQFCDGLNWKTISLL